MRGTRLARWVCPSLCALGYVLVLGNVTSARAEDVRVTDRDRMFGNYTYESGVVQPWQLRLEIRGLIGHDESHAVRPRVVQANNAQGFEVLNPRFQPQLIHRGFPAGDQDIPERRDDLVEVSGGRIELVGSFGLFSGSEVGFILPGIIQGLTFANRGGAETASDFKNAVREAGQDIVENEEDFGDMTVYGKYKHQLTEDLALGGGLEVRIPTGSESKRLGVGEVGTMPFVNMRYVFGKLAFGGNVGYQINEGELDDVIQWGLNAQLRPNEGWVMRAEIIGRHFDYDTSNSAVSDTTIEALDDVYVMPGFDYNFSDALTIRPTGLAGISNEALDWGIGVGVSFVF